MNRIRPDTADMARATAEVLNDSVDIGDKLRRAGQTEGRRAGSQMRQRIGVQPIGTLDDGNPKRESLAFGLGVIVGVALGAGFAGLMLAGEVEKALTAEAAKPQVCHIRHGNVTTLYSCVVRTDGAWENEVPLSSGSGFTTGGIIRKAGK